MSRFLLAAIRAVVPRRRQPAAVARAMAKVPQPYLTADSIRNAGLSVAKVSFIDFAGPSRMAPLPDMRAALVAVARRRRWPMSFPDINRAVLCRSGSHTTAFTALRRFRRHKERNVEGLGMTLGQLADRIEAAAEQSISLSPHRAASAGRGGIPGGWERA